MTAGIVPGWRGDGQAGAGVLLAGGHDAGLAERAAPPRRGRARRPQWR